MKLGVKKILCLRDTLQKQFSLHPSRNSSTTYQSLHMKCVLLKSSTSRGQSEEESSPWTAATPSKPLLVSSLRQGASEPLQASVYPAYKMSTTAIPTLHWIRSINTYGVTTKCQAIRRVLRICTPADRPAKNARRESGYSGRAQSRRGGARSVEAHRSEGGTLIRCKGCPAREAAVAKSVRDDVHAEQAVGRNQSHTVTSFVTDQTLNNKRVGRGGGCLL